MKQTFRIEQGQKIHIYESKDVNQLIRLAHVYRKIGRIIKNLRLNPGNTWSIEVWRVF